MLSRLALSASALLAIASASVGAVVSGICSGFEGAAPTVFPAAAAAVGLGGVPEGFGAGAGFAAGGAFAAGPAAGLGGGPGMAEGSSIAGSSTGGAGGPEPKLGENC